MNHIPISTRVIFSAFAWECCVFNCCHQCSCSIKLYYKMDDKHCSGQVSRKDQPLSIYQNQKPMQKKKPIRFTKLSSSLRSVVHQSTVTWTGSHFHEEQKSTEDDQRRCWPPMRGDTSVVTVNSLERTLHVTQTWQPYLFSGLWHKLCVRETDKPILQLEAFKIFSFKEMSLSTFKSECHDDYGTWQEQSNTDSQSVYSSANISCATHEETKVGKGFDTTHRSKTL
jgi:hypothetical protein